MSKVYEFTGKTLSFNGRTLHEIQALVDIAEFGVSSGDLGGWIETKENLTQSGEAWVFPNAKVYGRARIHGGTFRGGTFEGGTFRGGTFWGGTFEGGTFWGGTFWGGTFRGGTFEGGTFRGGTFRGGTFEGGTFRGGTFEGGTFRGGTFLGGTSTKLQPIFISGLTWEVTITDSHMRIGCQQHTLSDWFNFDNRKIAEMDKSALKFWKIHKPMFEAICQATGRIKKETTNG